jgi:multiple sugar transport system permease protein
MKRRPLSLGAREAIWGYALAAPMLLGMLIFFYLPLGASFFIGFTKWDVLTAPKWVGLDNYIRLFSNPLFYKTLWNTTKYALMLVPSGMAVSLILALALNRSIRFRSLYRLIYFLPVLTVPVAIALVWQWIYNPQYGLFSQVLGLKLPWLTDLNLAMPSLVIMAIWMGCGYGMVIFLAGLQNIPRTYYEAARVDGANGWQQFVHITLPLLTPTIFFNLLTSMISAFQTFDIVYIMTKGGPLDATRTIVYTIWEDGFHYFRMGSATAEAWILFMIILIIALFQFRSQKQWVHYV